MTTEKEILYRDKVKVIKGFHKGRIGEVVNIYNIIIFKDYLVRFSIGDYEWISKRKLKKEIKK